MSYQQVLNALNQVVQRINNAPLFFQVTGPNVSDTPTDELKVFVDQMRQTVSSFSLIQFTPTDVPMIHRALCTLRDECKLFATPPKDANEVLNRIVLPGWDLFLSINPTIHGLRLNPSIPCFTIHWNEFYISFLYTGGLKRTREREQPARRAAKRARK